MDRWWLRLFGESLLAESLQEFQGGQRVGGLPGGQGGGLRALRQVADNAVAFLPGFAVGLE